MKQLTEKQKKMLSFIEDRLHENNSPSQREIAGHFGLSQNAVCQLIGYLKKKEYLADSGGHRGLRLSRNYLEETKQIKDVPLVGRVAAGEPILAQQNVEKYVNFEELFKRSVDTFILKVHGDSMVDAGIMEGDYVVIRPDSNIKSGDIGVVMVDDEATVKKVHIRKDCIVLEPANSKAGYKARYIKRDNSRVRIIGKVTGCFRTL
jgi:repressor LexA